MQCSTDVLYFINLLIQDSGIFIRVFYLFSFIIFFVGGELLQVSWDYSGNRHMPIFGRFLFDPFPYCPALIQILPLFQILSHYGGDVGNEIYVCLYPSCNFCSESFYPTFDNSLSSADISPGFSCLS